MIRRFIQYFIDWRDLNKDLRKYHAANERMKEQVRKETGNPYWPGFK